MFDTQEMTGSGGSSSKYTLVAVTSNARIGTKELGDGITRIRVEPRDGAYFSFPSAWKTPGSGSYERRYSIVVANADVKAAVLDAFRVITGAKFATASAFEGSIPPVKPVNVFPGYKSHD